MKKESQARGNWQTQVHDLETSRKGQQANPGSRSGNKPQGATGKPRFTTWKQAVKCNQAANVRLSMSFHYLVVQKTQVSK